MTLCSIAISAESEEHFAMNQSRKGHGGGEGANGGVNLRVSARDELKVEQKIIDTE